MKRALILAVFIFLLVIPVGANDNGAGTVLFARVPPYDVHHIAIYEGMGITEHSYRADGCDEIAPLGTSCGHDLAQMTLKLQTITAAYWVTSLHIQPFTWDFSNGVAKKFTPLAWMVVIQYADTVTQHRISLSCYNVNDMVMYECYLAEGASDVPWHYNAWAIDMVQLNTVLREVTQ